ncbi:MAG TPA: apolipoprotein N-acyltransferase, partial [Candidatus Binatia bacterium]|nr:apolipoprotein N-acyltransferase [Candidatus Binatia bacterium]
IAFLPLYWCVLRAPTPRKAFLRAWAAGALAHVIGFYWIDHTVRVFGGIPIGLSEIVLLGFAVLNSLHIALFGLLVYFCGLGPLMLVPPLLWTAIEFFAPQLFPWHLANSQAGFLAFIQSADLFGPYGASFLLAWTSAALYGLFFTLDRGARVRFAGAALCGVAFIGNIAYGELRLRQTAERMSAAPKVEIAAIQGSVDIDMKWDPARVEANLKPYLDLTRQTPGARLYLWPESAVEAWIPEDAQRLPPQLMPQLPQGSSLIFGAMSFRGRPGSPGSKAFNSAFHVAADGRVLGHYHKQALLAFGETLPFAPVLGKIPFMPPIGEGFTRGEGPGTLEAGGIKAAPLICYEDIMPELARAAVAEKDANLLVNLTNDAWFGRTIAPYQHARLSQLRAIETRRALVRVTNTGLTTVIDARGGTVEELPIYTPGVLTAKVVLLEGKTPYVKYGDWFGWMMTVAALAVIVGSWKKR